MIRGSALGVALLGSAVIAVTYGLARFVFGLFLPAMRADLGIDPATAGIIGALPFASYVAAILVAPRLSQGLGLRYAAVLTVGCAGAGLLGIAHAPGPVVLGLGVVICGISTGLSSPIMADAVHALVAPAWHGRVNAAINASTSLGVAVAPVTMALFGAAWRPAYDTFAVLAALAMVAAFVFLPRRKPAAADPPSPTASRRGPSRQQIADIVRLGLLGGVMGVVSALYWVFAPDFAVHAGGLAPQAGAWIWLAVGIGGLAGVGAGDLVARHGLAISHAFAMAVLAAALTLLAAAPGNLALAIASAAVFGAAYMTLTGIYLVASTEIRADRPAAGPVVPFLAIASGQVAGSALGGGLVEALSYGTSFGAFAALGLAASLVSLAFDAPSRRSAVPAPAVEGLRCEG